MFGSTIDMGEAAIITLFSMGVVFATLLFISFMLDGFKIVFAKKPTEKKSQEARIEPQAPIAVAPKEDEEELIAVITAAIAAHLGKSSDGLIVRSIVQVRNQEPAWAQAGRMELMK
jgi:sodium pump decarboxylase gamma subunit